MISFKIQQTFIEIQTDFNGIITNIVDGTFLKNEFVISKSVYEICPFLENLLDFLPSNETIKMESLIIISDNQEFNIDAEILKSEVGVFILIQNRTTLYKYINKLNQSRNDLFFLKRQIDEKNLELEKLSRIAEKANKEKSLFLAMMSHEIRNPLHIILSYIELIDKENTSLSIKESLKYISISGKNLQVIVDDILDLSRIEAGKLQLAHQSINLEKLLNQIRAIFKKTHKNSEVELQFFVDKRIPRYVLGDDVRLYQILINLLNNSIKFTSKGFVKTAIEFIAKKDNTAIISFTISDTGRGMSQKQAKTIFEEYKQNRLDDNRINKGAGLGLTIVNRLVNAMNGSISVNSELHKGTSFTVKIPFVIDNQLDIIDIVDENLEHEKSLKGIKILVADDSYFNLTIVSHILKEQESEFVLVKDGVEALNEMLKTTFDLILLDINMPNLSGDDLVRQKENYKKTNANTPILAITANNTNDNIASYFEIGFKDFILKPFSKSQFLEILRRNL
ncbi:MAG: ATP-binding protein [Polaribacter sp.]|nr:ATP-binding protein [Polaribacter sp.]